MSLRSLLLLVAVAICGTPRSRKRSTSVRTRCSTRKFDFKVKATEHFDIYYYPKNSRRLSIAARMANGGMRACRACSGTSSVRGSQSSSTRASAFPADERDLEVISAKGPAA
jgi:hypothetical protein